MPEWTPDPVVPKFIPDPELMARVQRDQMAEEEEYWSQPQRYVRQQWENALSALRVACDSLAAIVPVEAGAAPEGTASVLMHAKARAESAYVDLDTLAESFYKQAMVKVSEGFITTHEQLDEEGVPR